MQSVFSRSQRMAAALLLLVVLLTPSAFASGPSGNPNLWAQFVAWFEGRIGIPGGFTAADESSFTLWLMGRLHIQNG